MKRVTIVDKTCGCPLYDKIWSWKADELVSSTAAKIISLFYSIAKTLDEHNVRRVIFDQVEIKKKVKGHYSAAKLASGLPLLSPRVNSTALGASQQGIGGVSHKTSSSNKLPTLQQIQHNEMEMYTLNSEFIIVALFIKPKEFPMQPLQLLHEIASSFRQTFSAKLQELQPYFVDLSRDQEVARNTLTYMKYFESFSFPLPSNDLIGAWNDAATPEENNEVHGVNMILSSDILNLQPEDDDVFYLDEDGLEFGVISTPAPPYHSIASEDDQFEYNLFLNYVDTIEQARSSGQHSYSGHKGGMPNSPLSTSYEKHLENNLTKLLYIKNYDGLSKDVPLSEGCYEKPAIFYNKHSRMYQKYLYLLNKIQSHDHTHTEPIEAEASSLSSDSTATAFSSTVATSQTTGAALSTTIAPYPSPNAIQPAVTTKLSAPIIGPHDSNPGPARTQIPDDGMHEWRELLADGPPPKPKPTGQTTTTSPPFGAPQQHSSSFGGDNISNSSSYIDGSDGAVATEGSVRHSIEHSSSHHSVANSAATSQGRSIKRLTNADHEAIRRQYVHHEAKIRETFMSDDLLSPGRPSQSTTMSAANISKGDTANGSHPDQKTHAPLFS